jgi:hypothetical protein
MFVGVSRPYEGYGRKMTAEWAAIINVRYKGLHAFSDKPPNQRKGKSL